MIDTTLLALIFFIVVESRIHTIRNKKPRTLNTAVVMDTSALIDGRVLDIAKVGFLQSRIIVPKIVLRELQLLADGRDAHKRERARLGLDVVAELQQLKPISVIIDDFKEESSALTDDLLIKLAKRRRAYLCTTDFNLNKVAVAEGVKVLNVNELAQVLRPKVLPSEEVEVKIIQKGETHMQGVGYLDDGTMVVVDGAVRKTGKTVTATVDRMIQTKAGKMIFAKLKS